MDVFGLVFTERHTVFADEGRALAVGIILPRATAVVTYLVVFCRQAHPHAKLGHRRQIGGFWLVVHINHDAAVGLEIIGQRQVRADSQSQLNYKLSAFCVNVLHGTFLSGILPDSGAFCEMGCMLIVVLGFPEVGLQWSNEHLLAIEYQRSDGTRIGEGRRPVICHHLKPFGSFMCYGVSASKGQEAQYRLE